MLLLLWDLLDLLDRLALALGPTKPRTQIWIELLWLSSPGGLKLSRSLRDSDRGGGGHFLRFLQNPFEKDVSCLLVVNEEDEWVVSYNFRFGVAYEGDEDSSWSCSSDRSLFVDFDLRFVDQVADVGIGVVYDSAEVSFWGEDFFDSKLEDKKYMN